MCILHRIISPKLYKYSDGYFFFLIYILVVILMTNPTVNAILSPGVQSVRLKSMALLVSLFTNVSGLGRLTVVSHCCHLRNLHGVGKKSNHQEQIQK